VYEVGKPVSKLSYICPHPFPANITKIITKQSGMVSGRTVKRLKMRETQETWFTTGAFLKI
jgi:hypothetical protein